MPGKGLDAASRERAQARGRRCSFEKCQATGTTQVRWRYVTGNPRVWYCEEHFDMLGDDAVEVVGRGRDAEVTE